MKRFNVPVLIIAVVALVFPVVAQAQKKVKPYQAQATYTFVNGETVSAHGLTVVLSADGVVKTQGESGQAGPFRNVNGNGTAQITMTNPSEPVAPGGDGLELVFSSYKNKLEIKSWWWVDAKGKRIGKKNKG